MRYHDITQADMNNGSGLRTVLWLAGCNHHCKGCQNPVTWDINGGIAFDIKAEEELFSYIDQDYCDGLTLSGGDPMHPFNRKDVTDLCIDFRQRYGSSKTIWMYTGYLFHEIEKEPIMSLIDVLVDGPYIEEQRNVQRYWCGSDNQEIWSKDEYGRWQKNPKQYEKSLNELNLDEQHHKECGCG